jgi:putative membrane protein
MAEFKIRGVRMSKLSFRSFTQSELAKIEASVKDAESKTSGEIVPYVVEHSDHYEEAEWRGGVLLGAVALCVFAAIRKFTTVWLPLDLAEVALTSLLAAGVGALLVRFLSPLRRFFAGSRVMDRRIHQRAAEAFISEEVFNTRNRTGVLIFLSLLERRVLVVGDSGINAKVQQSEWGDVVQTITAGIRHGRPADGLILGIQKCGTLLQKAGVQIRPDDKDELPDYLRKGT